MQKGIVKWFDLERNHGFIQRDNDADVFVDGSVIEGGKPLNKGEHVNFELKEGDGRPKASRVVRA
ncbi:MAG: cold-shock protein [Candidatus Thorarchaeota archaeon]